MEIYIAGVNHFDPLCKSRLQGWLKSLLDTHATRPLFIAVEWDEDIFEKIKLQRPKVRTLAASRWAQTTPEFLDALELAIAFEADTHNSLMPEVETIWLDHGRTLPFPNIIERYAIDRLGIYEVFIPENTISFDANLLKIMSVNAWKLSDEGEENATERDIKFAETIMNRCSPIETAWAIAIVGHKHTNRKDGVMAHRLESVGYNCEIVELRP